MFERESYLSKSDTMQQVEKQARANEVVRSHVGYAMGAALVPFPGADLLAVSVVQLNMLRQLAKLYNVGFIDSLGRNVISAVVTGGVARLGASLIKAIPGVGTVIGELSMPILSGASTYALGQVVARHFHEGGTLEDLDVTSARKRYAEEIKTGQKVASETTLQEVSVETEFASTDQTLDKLKKLADLKAAGIITEDEFKELKTRLLAQL